MRVCRSCGATNLDPGRFCGSCGAVLVATCAQCAQDLPDGAGYCPACGHPTDAGAPSDEARLKVVTVLFADVVSSTASLGGMHPEDAHALLTSYFEAMAQEIERQGGSVEKYIGDAIMAVFGVPVAHEDDPMRAVRAALAMQRRLQSWNAARPEAERIGLRIGINTDEVLASGSTSRDSLVTGQGVNLAARLEAAARPGAILIGERTARAVRAHVELTELDPLEVKGKDEPIAAWAVVGERLSDPVLGTVSSPLVGRDHELRVLHSLFERVRHERRPAVVTLVGDAGVGKSRLAREFVTRLPPEVRRLTARVSPYGEDASLAPLAQILTREAGIESADRPDQAMTKVELLVDHTVPATLVDRAMVTAGLAATLGLESASVGGSAGDPREVRRALTVAWRALLSGLARSAAVVLVIEDIHWADQAMLDLLADVAEHVSGPLFVVCLTRPELFRHRPEWGGARANYTALNVDALPRPDAERLLAGLLGAHTVSAAVAQPILRTAEGNPFFLEELVRHLLEERKLVAHDGAWRASTDEITVPDTVHGVVLARLDILPTAERQVVQRASVVGRVFWPGAIGEVHPVDALDQILRSLQRRGLVTERLGSSITGEAEYAFRHGLIAEVAYETLPRRARGEAHAAVARWLEGRTAGGAADEAERLAHHYYRAFGYLRDDAFRERARATSLTAARNALSRFAIREAELLGRRAAELSEAGVEQVEALEALGDLYDLTFRGDGAWDAYRAALRAHHEAGADDAAAVARLAAKAATQAVRWRVSMRGMGSAEEVEALIRQGLEAAARGEPRDRVLLLTSQSFLLTDADDESPDRQARAEAMAREALKIAEGVADPDLVSASLDAVISSLRADARYAEIEPLNRRRLELAPSVKDPKEFCDVHAVAAGTAIVVGRYADAVDLATTCIERARGVHVGQYLHGLILRTWSLFVIGKWEAALADHAAIAEVESEHEIPSAPALWSYGVAMLCHQLRGEIDAADRCLAVLRAHLGPAEGWAQYHRNTAAMARALALRGDVDDARSLLHLGRGPYLPDNLEALCEVATAAREWARAGEVVALCRAEAVRAGAAPLGHAADRLEGRAAASAGRFGEAEVAIRRAADGFAELGARWEAARSELALGEVQLLAGSRADASDTLARARMALREIGSIDEADRAEELLRQASV